MTNKIIKKDAKNVLLQNFSKLWIFYSIIAVIESTRISFIIFFTKLDFNAYEQQTLIPDPKDLLTMIIQGAVIGVVFIVSYYYSSKIKSNKNIDNNELFNDVKNRGFKFATLKVLINILLFLWSILIIPYFIKIYSYSMALFIYREQDISYKEAIDQSKRIMKGNKFKLFLIDLSLIPYYLLSLLTLNLYLVWLKPYHFQIRYNFYLNLKDDFTVNETKSTRKWHVILALISIVIAMIPAITFAYIPRNNTKILSNNIYDTINNNQCNYMDNKVIFNDFNNFIVYNPKEEEVYKLLDKPVKCFYQFDSVLYYSQDKNLYKMNLSTLENEVIYEDSTGYFITDNKKIYIQNKDNVVEIDLTTNVERVIVEGDTTKGIKEDRFSNINMLNIDENYLYYSLNDKDEFYRINRVTYNNEMILDMAIANPIVYNDKIYYSLKPFGGALYQCELNGSKNIEIIPYSLGIKLSGNYYYSTISGPNERNYLKVNINSKIPLKTNISQEIQLTFVGDFITGIDYRQKSNKYYYIKGKKIIEVKLEK